MSFTGKYQLQSQENFEAFMRQWVRLSDDLIKKNGKHFKITITTGSQVMHNEFTLGEEAEMDSITGEKVKTVINLEGDHKLVTTFKNIESVTELNGDTLIS
uniref:Uncharacterized protein n=1 Tax=Cavia porcellus TaxID=10141 RepID=A0A286XMC1_CAVPO